MSKYFENILQFYIKFLFFILQYLYTYTRVCSCYKNRWFKNKKIYLIFSNNQFIFLKNGYNLDSLLKSTLISIIMQLLSTIILILDKYLIIFLIKKNTESILFAWTKIIAKYKQYKISFFSMFWYSSIIFIILLLLL